MEYFDDTIDGATITAIDLWLDREVSQDYKSQPLAQDWARVAKVAEELGEVISALIGYTGQNPRKGFCAEQEDMLDELADVVATATLAIQHFTKDNLRTRRIISDKLTFILMRVPR